MLPNMLPSATVPLEKLLTNPSPYKRNSQESDFGPYKRNSVKSKSVNPGKFGGSPPPFNGSFYKMELLQQTTS